MIVIIGKLWSL